VGADFILKQQSEHAFSFRINRMSRCAVHLLIFGQHSLFVSSLVNTAHAECSLLVRDRQLSDGRDACMLLQQRAAASYFADNPERERKRERERERETPDHGLSYCRRDGVTCRCVVASPRQIFAVSYSFASLHLANRVEIRFF